MAASNPGVVTKMLARLTELADPKNGYRTPQLNIPHPRSLPALHNGTWAPFKKLGEELPPMAPDDVTSAAAALVNAYWD